VLTRAPGFKRLRRLLRSYPVRVRGPSMLPTLRPGAIALALPLAKDDSVLPGDVVLARHPQRHTTVMIKRVLSLADEGALLAGDNPAASTESVDFGPVPRGDLLARVTWRLWPLPPQSL
jgi:nickel-type superoxide dismutase maturation protease